ncbi:MAG: CRISPR-associated endonuclease Cas2 [Candidatus Aenigmarchaeota archaeon ex4484_52]|nr:MAG: CRISPR-associated endonuclease Cas2 [Candidatus Aenigmarchaeota archaeon ex4484_52]
MYVIIVYDINVERVSCVYKFFLKYLYWVQNSVFEGNLREKEFAEIILYLKKHIKDKDNVLIYKISGGKKQIEKVVLGKEKSHLSNILE